MRYSLYKLETWLHKTQQKQYIKTLRTALEILHCFTVLTPEQGVSEISQKLDIHKSTVSRTLSTLASGDILVKSPSNKKYRLGSKIMELASVFLSVADLRTVALPYMEELRSKTSETISLFIMDRDSRVCLDRLESPKSIRMTTKIGGRTPLYAGAPGKLFLAYLSEDKKNELLATTKLHKFTPNTITDMEKLKEELKKIRKQGFAVSLEERVAFGAAVAAPIMNHTGDVIAALSIHGPVMRFGPKKIALYSVLVRDTANKLSRELGYQWLARRDKGKHS